MRIRMGKKIGIVAAICAAAVAGIAITAGVNSHNAKENTLTDMENSFGKENLAEELIEGLNGKGAETGDNAVSIADALGTEAGAAAGVILPGADQDDKKTVQDKTVDDKKDQSSASKENNTGTGKGQEFVEKEEIIYEDVPGAPETVVERRAVTNTRTERVETDPGVERVYVLPDIPDMSGEGEITAVKGQYADTDGQIIDTSATSSFEGPDDEADLSSSYVLDGSFIYDEENIVDVESIRAEKELARKRYEEALKEQERIWAEEGYGTSENRVGDDVFIVFE